ncbi:MULTISPECIES: MetQ/NlpA family ABC transporter substrate-binding protein [Fictibacillus]|uniref:Lipoprotein n=1 Tax=Fictibacillus terranigra TaxID=3058424 RepID=A0ABT8E847_9BACL|nr:MetQ/NlpA family ABC transporter substrate-binding protein [Fictibacillus sp. CENA-BCM004]MDN4074069.1 MetQ/NlpA family ABC transporter substrate-binding protein [Fictibacillus sp. CENA-BCM004]
MRLKKWGLLLLGALIAAALTACGSSSTSGDGKNPEKLTVGASNVPHAVILKEAVPLLKKKGIDLKIVKFQDYVLPNKALFNKEIDANYFQHIPYLEQQLKENPKYKFENAGAIHIEPMGVYSKKYKSLKELPDGAKVILSNSVAEHGRILSIFEKAGLIKLKAGVGYKAQLKDIVENPKHLKFKADIEPALLTKAYQYNEGDAIVINTNYAIDAGLNPKKDSIELEGTDSPFANIITVRKGDKDKKAVKTLVEVLHSKQIQSFIEKEYKGAVLPVSE